MNVVGKCSENVSTGVWCVPGFGAGFEIALKPSKLQKEGENPEKRPLLFSAPSSGMHRTLVQERSEVLSPHGSRPNSKNRGER